MTGSISIISLTLFIISRTLGATARLYLVINVLQLFILEDIGISFGVATFIILLMILPFIEQEFPHLAARYRSAYASSPHVSESYRAGLSKFFARLCEVLSLPFDAALATNPQRVARRERLAREAVERFVLGGDRRLLRRERQLLDGEVEPDGER